MTEEKNNKNIQKEEEKKTEQSKTDKGAKKAVAGSVYGANKKNKKSSRKFNNDKKDEFDQRILDLARVTRVMAGGKRMRFRATVAVGDKKGKVGVGMGKGADVTIAVNKAVNDAKKKLIEIPMVQETIPHEVYKKYGASKILIKPAAKGRGVIAGGVVRVVLELGGVKNITCKILGTNNKVNNSKCTIEALKELKVVGKNSNLVDKKDKNDKIKKDDTDGKIEDSKTVKKEK